MKILLVEDNPGDIRLTEEALKELDFMLKMRVAENGEEAIAFLKKEGKFKDVFDPNLILLDLNLPKKDGREVLKEIKEDLKLRKIPIIILTSSNAIEESRYIPMHEDIFSLSEGILFLYLKIQYISRL